MPQTAAEILEAARQLNVEEQSWLLESLQQDEFAAWQKECGNENPDYDAWFRARVEEALADTSPGIPHDEVVREMDDLLRTLSEQRALKASA